MTTATLGIAVASNADKAAVDLDKLVAASGRAEAGVEKLASASTRAGAATQQMSLNSANIAAQLQDVAVSAQMGMNPLQVALQQGTQLSAVLNQVRSSGVGVGTALATSFMSIINPISLVTIGLIGIGTFGLQALGGMLNKTDEANDALEEHSKWLDEILVGYDDARDAAERVVEQALKLPQGALQSDLIVRQKEAQEAYAAAVEEVIAANTRLRLSELDLYDTASSANGTAREQADLLLQLKDGLNSANPDLDGFIDALTEIRNNATDDVIRDAANELLGLANQARVARAQADSLSASLRAIPTDIRIRLSMSEEFGSAMGEMKSLFMDPRSQFDVARENLTNWAQQATATANTYGELVAVGDEYIRVLESINAAEAKANAKKPDREAERSAERWGSSAANFQHRIDMQQLEIELFGQSTYEIERQKAALDLLNEAKQAGIPITAEVTETITRMSSEYAAATAELERMQYQQQQIDALNNTLASGFANLFTGILDGSQSAEEGIANLLKSLGNLLINQAFQSLFAPTALGGGGFNPFAFMMGPGRASGGPVHPGMIYPVNENTPNTEYFAPAVSGTILTAQQVAGAAMGAAGGRQEIDVRVSVDQNGNILAFARKAAAQEIANYDRFQAPETFRRVSNDPYARG